MAQHKKRIGFWDVYKTVFVLALILVLAFLAVFSDIMRHYEKSQPLSGAWDYANALTDGEIEKIITTAASDSNISYASSDDIADALRKKTETEDFVITKDFGSYTAEAPVYILSVGELPFYRLTLAEGDPIRYGFTSWKVKEAEAILSVDEMKETTFHLFVPRGATLFINGTEAEHAPARTSPYRYPGKWETNGVLQSDHYEIPLICEVPFTARLNGEACELVREEDGVHFRYPDSSLFDCTIEAPAHAVVWVNGLPLGEADIIERDIPYVSSPVEASKEALPTAVRYLVKGLLAKPAVTAEMDGMTVPFVSESNVFRGEYPEEMTYTCSIRVPEGTSVSVNGIPCPENTITAKEKESEALFSYSASVPAYDVYTLTGLFFPPEDVEVTYHGAALPFNLTKDGNTYTYRASYPTMDAPDTVSVGLGFIKDYFIYTSHGSVNTSANLANVLRYIPYGCDLYWKMVQSENGFSWTASVMNMTYNTLDVVNVFAYGDDLRLCEVVFDVTQEFYGGVIREYKGTMMLLLTMQGKVVGMEIEAK